MKKVYSFAQWCEDNNKSALLEQWDYEKNIKYPTEISPHDKTLIWWKCDKDHSWQAKPERRIHHKTTDCPVCTQKILSAEYNLKVAYPKIAAQWDYEKNDKNPAEVFPNDNTSQWWKCKKGHSWAASPNSRVSRLAGCPYCDRIRPSDEYNLAVLYPTIAAEWDYDKNIDRPEDYMPKSDKKVFWKCILNPEEHQWIASISNRTSKPSMCPKCKKELSTSFPEQTLFYYLSQIFHKDDVINQYEFESLKLNVDIYIHSLNLAIEYDGAFFHKNDARKKRDFEKAKLLKGKNITLLRIKEIGGGYIPPSDYMITCSVDTAYKYMNNVVVQAIEFINNEYHTNYIIRPDITKDTPQIYSQYIRLKKENSFAQKHPELISEWNYNKNGKILPEMLSFGSGRKVWWVCEKGHEWKTEVCARSRGSGCPYCANLKVHADNCLATINKKSAKLWNYERNGNLTPRDVIAGSGKKVWWKCREGHEWQMSVFDAAIRNYGCPYCSRHRTSELNALAIKNPQLAYEWNYERNDKGLNPNTISYSSSKKVWWKCKKGHEWQEKVGNRSHLGLKCPFCSGKRVTEENNFLVARPELAVQWHPVKNGELQPKDILPQSNKSVWWQCNKGHEWKAAPATRFSGSGCPYCCGKKVCEDNSLASVYPYIAKYWHHEKNGDKTAENTYCRNKKKVWWKCDKGHEWKRSTLEMLDSKGCPYCTGYLVSKETSLSELMPELANEWNYEKNGTLNPHDVKLGSHKKYGGNAIGVTSGKCR